MFLFPPTVASRRNLCYENEAVAVGLQTESVLRIEYWAEPGRTGGDLACHFWCNGKGDLPLELPIINAGADLLNQLVRQRCIIRLWQKYLKSDLKSTCRA